MIAAFEDFTASTIALESFTPVSSAANPRGVKPRANMEAIKAYPIFMLSPSVFILQNFVTVRESISQKHH
jgi:hypothetical protein